MKTWGFVCLTALVVAASTLLYAEDHKKMDWRKLENGKSIPLLGMKYVDQPYPLVLNDGTWLCMVTVGPEAEGKGENHSVVLVSTDQGTTWSKPVRCLQTYAVPFQTPNGRIFALHPSNFSYSDDHGRTWSEPVSVPEAVCRIGGRSGWGVAKPIVVGGSLFLPWAYVGLSGPPRKTEVFFNVSSNIVTEPDPVHIHWSRLPSGENGLRGPDWKRPSNRSEEPHLVALSDNTLYTVWRTDQGFIGTATSPDLGRTWTKSQYVRYADGRLIKHPLACPSLWKCSNGKFLLWVHNQNHNSLKQKGNPYRDRNPAWICGGVERDGTILWSQPEILLYSDDLSYQSGRISYPGFLESEDRYWIFETQKTCARVHEIDPALLKAMWSQSDNRSVAERGCLASFDEKAIRSGRLQMPNGGLQSTDGSFSIELAFERPGEPADTVLLDTQLNYPERDAGFVVDTTLDGYVRLTIRNGEDIQRLQSDIGLLKPGTLNHVVFIVDTGPKTINCVLNGKLCDGGEHRQYGWLRYDGDLGSAHRVERLVIAPEVREKLSLVRIYSRYLLTSEAVGNYRACISRHLDAVQSNAQQDKSSGRVK